MKDGGTDAIARDLVALFSVGSVGGLSDGELLGRFVERREADAFEALMHRHGPMVWGVCRRVLRDGHDAEDAFQATFLVLARKAASVLPREKIGHWLYGVAYQTARKAKATRDRRRKREGQVSVPPELMSVTDDPRDASTEDIDLELARLPEKYRIPIILCELEGKSHAGAAEQLGWPTGTVSSRLSRGKTLLAKRLSRSGVVLAAHQTPNGASADMPTRLVGPTAYTAGLFTAKEAMTAGTVSAEVATLTEGVLKLMLLKKLKAATVAALAIGLFGSASIGLSYRAWAGDAPPRAQGEVKAARLPNEGIRGWRVQVDKAGRSRVTLEANGARATFYADKVSVDPDGATDICGSIFSMSRKSLEPIEELARISQSRAVPARLEIEVDVDGCRASFVSKAAISVAVLQKDGLVYLKAR